MKSVRHLNALARRLSRDDTGVSAVEFAMILPLMLLLFLGGVEVSQAISADRKVTLLTRTVADLTSRFAKVSEQDVSNILNAGAAIMDPFTNGPLKVTVTCINIDNTGKATVYWSKTLNGTPQHNRDDVITLPSAALDVPNTTLIWSEVSYGYTPPIGYVITGTLTLNDEMYMRPRLSNTVEPVGF